MGSRHQIKRRISRCHGLQSIPTKPNRRCHSTRVYKKRTRKRVYLHIQVTLCITLLFHTKKKMASYDQCRITVKSMPSLCVTNTHFPLFWTSSTIRATHISTPSWMYDGDTTMYASEKATNTKQHSKPNTVYLNQQSCILASQTRQQPSKP